MGINLSKIANLGLGLSLGAVSIISPVRAVPDDLEPARYMEQSNEAYKEAAVIYCHSRWADMSFEEARMESIYYYVKRMMRMTGLTLEEVKALEENKNFFRETEETLSQEIGEICPEYLG